MVKLKRLKINKYRNVRPGTELHFDDGVNLVLGQNGAGKTTLLGLIASVTSNDFSHLKGDAFSFDYVMAVNSTKVIVHIESSGHASREEGTAAPAELLSREVDYRYSLSFEDSLSHRTASVEGTPRGVTVTVTEVAGQDLPPSSPFSGSLLSSGMGSLFTAVKADDGLLKIFWTPLLALVGGPVTRFDEAIDCFFAMTGRAPILPTAGVPSMSRLNFSQGPKVSPSIRSIQFTPWSLANVIREAHQNPGGAIRVELREPTNESPRDELEFLANAARTFGASAAALKPEVREVRETRTGTTVFEVEGFSFEFTRSDGSTVHHDRLSYGQKRLLAYYYYLAATEHFVIADELVNGLHHRWIEACMDAIGERQAFLTSQNPLLFEYVKFESVEQVQTCFITCKTEIVDGAEQLVWQNMARPDALSFFESYQADIESVGDILITRGLW